MNYIIKSDKEVEKGFIYVASRDVLYYELAVQACQSMRDYFPNAHVTLFTHKMFLDGREDIFDNVIVDIPVHYRTKMWAMARTPYKKTIYIDADSLIMHKDIKFMHDFLEDCDMFFCPVTQYTVSNFKLMYIDKDYSIPPKYHGAICGYNKSDLTIDFMQTWYDKYLEQVCAPNWPYTFSYDVWKVFDMFTLWRLTNSDKFNEFKKFSKLNINILPLRYIITAQHTEADKKNNKPVIHQVDRTTWQNIPSFWKRVQARINNEFHTFKKSPINKIPSEYN